MTTARTRKTTAPKKTAAKKTAAKKTAQKANTTTSEKTTTSAPAEVDDAGQVPRQTRQKRASAPRAESKPKKSATEVARLAAHELAQLTGKTPEAVTGVERTEEGWRVTVEVLEVRRIPETTDVLARYEIETDDKGALMSYRRAGRYTRGSTQED